MPDLKNILLDNQKLARQKLNLKLKITILTCTAAFLFFAAMVSFVYMRSFNEKKEMSAENNREMARLLSAGVSSVIEKQIDLLRSYASDPVIVSAAKEANAKYGAMGEAEAHRYLMDADNRWLQAPAEHPLVREYLDGKTSLLLKTIKRDNGTIASLIATDKFGGLLGATYRPSGFYSFEKDWWIGTDTGNGGKAFIGDVEYNEAARSWCVPIATVIKDETGSIIGVYRAEINIDVFFKPLQNFRVGRTGNATLVDDKAYLLYDRRTEPFANKFCEYSELSNVLQNEDKSGILSSVYGYEGKALASFSKVDFSASQTKTNTWYVFVEQSLDEVMAPVNTLILLMVVIGFVLLIILGLVVFILSGQEIPNYSVLQVIKDTSQEKAEEKNPDTMNTKENRLSHIPQNPQTPPSA